MARDCTLNAAHCLEDEFPDAAARLIENSYAYAVAQHDQLAITKVLVRAAQLRASHGSIAAGLRLHEHQVRPFTLWCGVSETDAAIWAIAHGGLLSASGYPEVGLELIRSDVLSSALDANLLISYGAGVAEIAALIRMRELAAAEQAFARASRVAILNGYDLATLRRLGVALGDYRDQ